MSLTGGVGDKTLSAIRIRRVMSVLGVSGVMRALWDMKGVS